MDRDLDRLIDRLEDMFPGYPDDPVIEGTPVERLSSVIEVADHRLRDWFIESMTDGMLGIPTRTGILGTLDWSVEQARETSDQVYVALLDIDHFKAINDSHGHAAGDHVLRRTTSTIQTSLGLNDTPGRYGGDEILIALPFQSHRTASATCERIRSTVEAERIPTEAGRLISVTVSIGLTGGTDNHANTLINAADRALYAAKANGRNRVEFRSPRASSHRNQALPQ